jgi:hypothetical protein
VKEHTPQVVAWLVPLEVNADHEWSGTHKDALKSSAVRGSMDAMERGVTLAPQLSRQGAVRQPILKEHPMDHACMIHLRSRRGGQP